MIPVTGATGNAGGGLVKGLLEIGAEVRRRWSASPAPGTYNRLLFSIYA